MGGSVRFAALIRTRWRSLRRLCNLSAVLLVLIAESADAAPFGFQGLGNLGDDSFFSAANGVSADGNVVVGGVHSKLPGPFNGQAFGWTAFSGMVGLGDLDGGQFFSYATDVSADGSVVVGSGSSAAGSEAFRWSAADGMKSLGEPSVASGISADASVIVGTFDSTLPDVINEGFRWTADDGMQGIGFLSSSSRDSEAFGVSADGSVVVGVSGPLGEAQAFRWTATQGMFGLGSLLGDSGSIAFAASADGSVVVGESPTPTSVGEAFRWTATDGMQGLGDLPGGSGVFANYSHAADISAAGHVIVGRGTSDKGAEAMFWNSIDGMLNLKDYLIAHGVTGLDDWTLRSANGVSGNGRVIVGDGINPNGDTEAWRAVISLLGDANGDGKVTGADYTLWADHFLQSNVGFENGDFNDDGNVTGGDYTLWADRFGLGEAPSQSTVQAVPEPATWQLGLAATLVAIPALVSAARVTRDRRRACRGAPSQASLWR